MKVTDETVLVFDTYTGSRYEINHGKVRRLNSEYEKRGDGNWYTLYNRPEIEVGQSAYLMMESVSLGRRRLRRGGRRVDNENHFRGGRD